MAPLASGYRRIVVGDFYQVIKPALRISIDMVFNIGIPFFFGFRTSKPIVVRASYTEGDRIFNSQLDHRLGMRDRGERLIISCGPISEVRIIECCPEL